MIEKKSWWASGLSLLFHPLIIPTLGVIILLSIPTYISFSTSVQAKRIIIAMVFFNTCIAPLTTMLLMKRMKIIPDLLLFERLDRIYPTIVSAFFYLFTYYLFRQANLPALLSYFIMGATLLVVVGFVVTYFWKISFHLMSMGGFTGFLIAVSLLLDYPLHLLIILAILISGLLGAARIQLNAHKPSQVYAGFLTGIAVMLSLFFWLMMG